MLGINDNTKSLRSTVKAGDGGILNHLFRVCFD